MTLQKLLFFCSILRLIIIIISDNYGILKRDVSDILLTLTKLSVNKSAGPDDILYADREQLAFQ